MPASTLTIPFSESQLKELQTVQAAIKQGTLNGTIRQLIRERIQLQITLDGDKRLIAEQSEKLIQYESLILSMTESDGLLRAFSTSILLSRNG